MVQCGTQTNQYPYCTSRTGTVSLTVRLNTFSDHEHSQFTNYCPTPLLLLLTPFGGPISTAVNAQTLPFKAYEPTIEIRDRKSRSVFIEAVYNVQTGEAERIAVDWTARGGGGGTSREPPLSMLSTFTDFIHVVESHLQAQRAAIKMLHERILVLVEYVTEVLAGGHTFCLVDRTYSLVLTSRSNTKRPRNIALIICIDRVPTR